MTRQREWQMRMKAESRCVICGKRAINKNHCRYHRAYRRKNQRERQRKPLGCRRRYFNAESYTEQSRLSQIKVV